MNNEILQNLKEHGYKMTTARKQIIASFEGTQHFTIDNIIAKHVELYNDKPNTQSVYNIINTLIDIDVLKQRRSKDETFYEYCHDHIHFYCESERIKKHFDNEAEMIKDIKEVLKSKYGIAAKHIDMDIKIGECSGDLKECLPNKD